LATELPVFFSGTLIGYLFATALSFEFAGYLVSEVLGVLLGLLSGLFVDHLR
jgi:hypothetical protein